MASITDTSEDLLAAVGGTVRLSQKSPAPAVQEAQSPGVVPTAFQSLPAASVEPANSGRARVAGWSLTTRLLVLGGWVLIVVQGALLFQAVGVLRTVVAAVGQEEMYRWHPAPFQAPKAQDLLDPVRYAVLLAESTEEHKPRLQRLRAHALMQPKLAPAGTVGSARAEMARELFVGLQQSTLVWSVPDRIAFAEAAWHAGYTRQARHQLRLLEEVLSYSAVQRQRLEQQSDWSDRLHRLHMLAIVSAL